MEWIEITGKSVQEAKETALDELGVDEADAEFEIVAEAKAGLFGLLRSEARVRARVMPTRARPKVEHRDRRRSGTKRAERPAGGSDSEVASIEPDTSKPRRSTAGRSDTPRAPKGRAPGGNGSANKGDDPSSAGASGAETTTDQPGRPRRSGNNSRGRGPTEGNTHVQEADKGGAAVDDDETRNAAIEVAEEFLSGVASRFSDRFEVGHRELADTDVVEVGVTGDDLGLLIGPRGQTLSSLQELTRTVVQRKVPTSRTRLMVDVAGYREARREALARFTAQVAEEVKSSGQARDLEPMSAADRKVVHDTANDIEGVTTTSEGEDPHRRVVISPA